MIAFIPDSLKSDVLAMIERFSFVDGEIEYVTLIKEHIINELSLVFFSHE